ncbi:penicillin acylase family protein [Aquirufa regiilacus]
MKKLLLLLLVSTSLFATPEIARWKAQAKRVTIYRDSFGVPHIYGKSDADAVFGMLYAQCEDDFSRVERNYIEKLGRLAEVEGEKQIANDLYLRLIIDPVEAKADFHKSPTWLKKLLIAYADGINYYLHNHPEVKPALLTHFEPWYPLLWTDGSIGAISTGDVTEKEVAEFYGLNSSIASNRDLVQDEDLTGSNGFAVGKSLSKSGNALLYINPHVTFYFRPEIHVNSETGMNVYGAVTWGQFFVYQGFNEYGGWMHTSSQVDVADMYQEKVEMRGAIPYYLLDGQWRPMRVKKINLRVKGELMPREITTYFTHRGAVMAQRNGQWISVRSYNRSLKSLEQSWLRTKTTGLESYKRIMAMRANTSNNTVYADNKGNIAYWHGNFVPIRDPRKDWGLVQDGTKSANDWKGLHPVEQIVHIINPKTAWIQNCNSTPFTVSGSASPIRANYPAYMAPDGENFRDKNAVRLFRNAKSMELGDLMRLGYDRHLAAFDVLIPSLRKAYAKNPLPELKELVDSLGAWDRNAQENSIAQHVAIRWANQLLPTIPKIRAFGGETDPVINFTQFALNATSVQLLTALAQVKTNMEAQFGTWKITWGAVNRFQRISNRIEFDDAKPSIPVAFTSSAWGQMPSYTSKPYKGSNKWYGVNGNSFVAAVEFGPKIKAYSLLAGGQSGDVSSPHFFDQAEMYKQGNFKNVLFYKNDVKKAAIHVYHP